MCWRYEHETKTNAWKPAPPVVRRDSQTPAVRGEVSGPWTPPQFQVRTEPWERKTGARSSLAIFQVRCLGTIGGLIDLVLGAVLGAPIGDDAYAQLHFLRSSASHWGQWLVSP